MSTILTDNERPKLPPSRYSRWNSSNGLTAFSADQMEAYADAREAAVLAKLAQQEPVRAMHLGWDTLDNGTIVATYALPVKNRVAPKLYTHPSPQQADRQRVPDGWQEAVKVAREARNPDFLDWLADRLVHVYGESANVYFVLCLRRMAATDRAALAQLDAMLAAAPEAPAAAVVQKAAAWVPVHPKTGPLWAMTTDSPDPERLPAYPLRSLYYTHPALAAAPEAPAQAECSDCNGTGADGGKLHDEAIPCSVCQGSGKAAAPEAPAQPPAKP